MAPLFLIFCFALSVFSQISDGAVRTILYNEEELTGSCVDTCSTLPDRTDKFGCDRIYNCQYNRHGWNKGFVRCDWCQCQCQSSDNLPAEFITVEKDKIITEPDLFGTCTGTCSASGLQFTDRHGCYQVRDCYKHKNGWTRGFVRCDYCECTCVIKSYPQQYRLENVDYDLNAVVFNDADRSVIGRTRIVNRGNEPQSGNQKIQIVYQTEERWDQGSSTSNSISIGTSVSITFEGILAIGREITVGTTTTKTFTWGETTSWTIDSSYTQEVTTPAHSSVEIQVTGKAFIADIPFTADLVKVYENGEERRTEIQGTLHEASVTDFQVEYGAAEPISG